MAGYHDREIGAVEEEGGAEGDQDQLKYNQILLHTAVEDFNKNFTEESKQ